MFKKLKLEMNDQIKTNIIAQEERKKHYTKLWFCPEIEEQGKEVYIPTIEDEDITMEELNLVLQK